MRQGIVAGSYDPITFGHIYVIQQALKSVDRLYVFVAQNANKTSRFGSESVRANLVMQALKETLTPEEYERVQAIPIGGRVGGASVVELAKKFGAQIYFRGIRNTQDFEYEHSLQLVNLEFEPTVTTFFVMPPVELTAVSSSMVKGLVGLNGWKKIAKRFVPSVVVSALAGVWKSVDNERFEIEHFSPKDNK